MADLAQWFKLWTSVLDDPELQELSIEDFGRWCIFGVFLKKHGNGGTITLPYSVTVLVRLLRLSDSESARMCVRRFPHCVVEVVKSGDDQIPSHIKVTWENWHKYQIDSSKQRMQKYRRNVTFQKRSRREEKRREERGGEIPHPPLSVWREKVNGLTPEERQLRQGDLVAELSGLHLPFEFQDQLINQYFIQEDENGGIDAVRGKSIDRQATERLGTQRSSGFRKTKQSESILNTVRNLPPIPPKT